MLCYAMLCYVMLYYIIYYIIYINTGYLKEVIICYILLLKCPQLNSQGSCSSRGDNRGTIAGWISRIPKNQLLPSRTYWWFLWGVCFSRSPAPNCVQRENHSFGRSQIFGKHFCELRIFRCQAQNWRAPTQRFGTFLASSIFTNGISPALLAIPSFVYEVLHPQKGSPKMPWNMLCLHIYNPKTLDALTNL